MNTTCQSRVRGYVARQHDIRNRGLLIDARTEFAAGPTTPALARGFVRQALSRWGYPAACETAALLTSELVTNAVLHAGTGVTVTVCARDGIVRVEVADGSARVPTTPPYGGEAQTGRGLALVQRVATTWGVERQPGGKTVWFEVET